MKKFICYFMLFYSIFLGSSSFAQTMGDDCSLIYTKGTLNSESVCELIVSQEIYDEVFEKELLDADEFLLNDQYYRLVVEESSTEAWIPIIDDLKVLGKDIKNNSSEILKVTACLTSSGAVTAQYIAPCAVCLVGAVGTAGALGPACIGSCGGAIMTTSVLAAGCL